MRPWQIHADKQNVGDKAWGLLCIRCSRHSQKKHTFNTEYMQHLTDKSILSVKWLRLLIQCYLTGVNIAIDTANRAQITTTDIIYILEETLSEYMAYVVQKHSLTTKLPPISYVWESRGFDNSQGNVDTILCKSGGAVLSSLSWTVTCFTVPVWMLHFHLLMVYSS